MDFQNADGSKVTITVHIHVDSLPAEAYAKDGTRKRMLKLTPKLIEIWTKSLLFLLGLSSYETSGPRAETFVRRADDSVDIIISDCRLGDLDVDDEIQPSQRTDIVLVRDAIEQFLKEDCSTLDEFNSELGDEP